MWLRRGWVDGVGEQTCVEKRQVSFMYSIVDKRIFLLSAKLMVRCPRRYRCDWFPKWVRSYFCRIAITLIAKVALRVAKKGHKNKKWFVSSIRWLQRHLSQWGYDIFYDILRYLSPLLVGRCTEVLKDQNTFFCRRIKDKIWFLRILKDGISLKWVITLFQGVIASGKKLPQRFAF